MVTQFCTGYSLCDIGSSRTRTQSNSTCDSFMKRIASACRNLNRFSRTFSTTRMSNSPYDAKIKSVEALDQGKWIQTRKINWIDPAGKERVWEMAVRTTRTETTGLDAVSIFALLKKKGQPSDLVLVKQFRPPCEKVVIEMPAGLIDPNESVESTAERELIEETGYHGKTRSSSHDSITLFSDPGLTNANMALVTVDVDMEDPRNQNPQAQTEDGEFIDVFTLPIDNLLRGLEEVCQKEGCVVDARLYHFAAGLDVAKRAFQ